MFVTLIYKLFRLLRLIFVIVLAYLDLRCSPHYSIPHSKSNVFRIYILPFKVFNYYLGSDVLTAVVTKSSVFWAITPFRNQHVAFSQ
jgi:hypothetical protein